MSGRVITMPEITNFLFKVLDNGHKWAKGTDHAFSQPHLSTTSKSHVVVRESSLHFTVGQPCSASYITHCIANLGGRKRSRVSWIGDHC